MNLYKNLVYVLCLLSLIAIITIPVLAEKSVPKIVPVTLASEEQTKTIKEHGIETHIFVWTREAEWPEGYYEVWIEEGRLQEFWREFWD